MFIDTQEKNVAFSPQSRAVSGAELPGRHAPALTFHVTFFFLDPIAAALVPRVLWKILPAQVPGLNLIVFMYFQYFQ
jgi:hypothetical protein